MRSKIIHSINNSIKQEMNLRINTPKKTIKIIWKGSILCENFYLLGEEVKWHQYQGKSENLQN